MIRLDFEFETDTCSFQEEDVPSSWPTGCYVGAFRGMQTFVVNGVDLSSSQAILFFAKRLEYVLKELEANPGPYIIEDLDSQWSVYLSHKGDYVEISPGPNCTLGADKPVRVKYCELKEAASEYLRRAFKAACDIFPPLAHNEYMADWIES